MLCHQLSFDALRIGFWFINLVNCHNNWNAACKCMVNRFFCLRHHTVISSNYQDHNIGRLSTTSTHCRKSFVTRGIQEGNHATRSFHMVSTDMLSNAAGLTSSYFGCTNLIEQGSFTVVNVTHHRYNWRTRQQLRIMTICTEI